jgi:cytochrome d ubiquinol oxidase subunit I
MLDNLTAAREQMALSLSFHIVFAVLGVGLPWLLLFAEGRALRRGDPVWYALARRWAKALAVLFAVGAVSGTVLSFEFGLLWPGFMERYGGVLGLPFTMEAFAFFLEAIFLGLYLYGWDRLSPRAHWWAGVPVAVSGMASALFVTTANAWMNAPVGVIESGGAAVVAQPLAPFRAPTAGPQVVHLLVAALMVTGFGVAAVYATGLLRGRRDAYHRRGFAAGSTLALTVAPLQGLVGDWASRAVARYQPVKFAALEGLPRTTAGAPLSIGGAYDPATGRLRGAIEIPRGLSLLLHGDPGAVVTGLDVVAPTDQPPVTVTHLAFDLMVGIGTALIALTLIGCWLWRRRRATSTRWFLRLVVLAAPASVTALLAGWVATEVGRQPWIVYRLMRTSAAVSTQPGLTVFLYVTAAVYLLLTISLVAILRRLATGAPAALTEPATPAAATGRGAGA